MKNTLQTMRQHMVQLFWKIAAEQKEITLDGVWGYNDCSRWSTDTNCHGK